MQSVGRGGRVAELPHHQLAGTRRLQILRPLLRQELDADADRAHVALPLFVVLARALVGLRRHAQHQRRAVGQVAPAVAVAVDIAVHVEQRLRARRAVVAHLALERRVVAAGVRHDARLRRNGLALSHQPDLALDVVGEADRAAQRDLVGRVATDDRIFHVEVGHRDVGVEHPLGANAALGEARHELAAGHRGIDELRRQRRGNRADHVGLRVEEGEPARLVLFDDRDMHFIDHRQAPAFEAREDRLTLRVVGGGLGVVAHVAEGRVALEHDQRRAAPLLEAKRPGAHGVRIDLGTVEPDDLARHAAEQVRRCEGLQKARPWLVEANADRVAVERLQPLGLAVVVERPLGLQRCVAQRLEPDDAFVVQARVHRAAIDRIEEALERVDVVLRDELARLAFERRVVGEVDARSQLDRPGAEVGRHLGHRRRRQRLDLDRPGQVVVGVQAFEDVRRDGARIEVDDLRRIEGRLGDGERHAQHLGGGRCLRARRRDHAQRDQQGNERLHLGPCLCNSSRSMSRYFQKSRTKTLRW